MNGNRTFYVQLALQSSCGWERQTWKYFWNLKVKQTLNVTANLHPKKANIQFFSFFASFTYRTIRGVNYLHFFVTTESHFVWWNLVVESNGKRKEQYLASWIKFRKYLCLWGDQKIRLVFNNVCLWESKFWGIKKKTFVQKIMHQKYTP